MLASHKSGGRDLWSLPSESAPADPVRATWDALGEVLDPELPVSLVDLGLIYEVRFEDGVAAVRLTYTATACPCMEFIREDIRDRLEQETWVREVLFEEVWDPPWTTERITEQGRKRLRSLGVGA
jgi:metal-sulfur cluster biosynthetic enzyme